MDQSLALSFTLYNTKGATALLLGSGLSSAAGILTGWGITLDLVRKVAAVEGEDAGPSPEEWYRKRFGGEPDYAKLLELLAPTPTERQRLLLPYFTASDEERQENKKQPTKAHHAIAQLVAQGFIRVILTTNFDPLLELALEAVGVIPAVVSDPGAIAGMMPLQHGAVTIIKLHGHYSDTRLRNTPEELAVYEPALANLLDRVLDEYGLIICGWSGVWDAALRDALFRCPSRRFSTFWASMGPLAEAAQKLANHRKATVIPIKGADEFFQGIAEKVASLEEMSRPHPASAAVAVAALKRYLPHEEQRIRLHDLVMQEVELLRAHIAQTVPAMNTHVGDQGQVYLQAVTRLEALSETMVALMATGLFWGTSQQLPLWLRAIERLGSTSVADVNGGYMMWYDLLQYPAMLALYAGGLGALAADNEEALIDLLLTPRLRDKARQEIKTPVAAFDTLFDEYAVRFLNLPHKKLTPVSDRVHEVLRPALRELVPEDADYNTLFDRLEYLISFTGYGSPGKQKGYVRYGRFYWRGARMNDNPAVQQVDNAIAKEGAAWLLLRKGVFEGSTAELAKAVEAHKAAIKEGRFARA
ncbi:hypothetical protein GCM10023185_36800 [Hymenobacter saemangeumensis]|uniref:SIR2-like domain-containing protein n=1 Tax=Hymenobacter saemangeumensis TaxID=1084522 RepID=A0ABP8IQP3_9BACT